MSGDRQPRHFSFRGQLSPTVRAMFDDLEQQRARERRRQGTITQERALDLLYQWADQILDRKRKKTVIEEIIPKAKLSASLEDRQRSMRTRQKQKVRLGRPAQQRDYEKLRRRITALIDLQAGKSVEFIAARLRKKPDAIRQWVERGMPLDGDLPG